MSPLAEKYDQARVSALDVLSRFIERKIGALPAARRLVSLRFPLIGDTLDDDWRVFVGIDSETDHLPTGEERKHWSAEALAVKDAEIKEAEEFYRDRAMEAARGLIRRLKKEANQAPEPTAPSGRGSS
jgi:hypothetical protein